MKHSFTRPSRHPVFLVPPMCRDPRKEWRRERWRDWREANGRSSGWFDSNRTLQFVFLRQAAEARKNPTPDRKLMVELYASCSKEERLKSHLNSLSPMAVIELDFKDSPL